MKKTEYRKLGTGRRQGTVAAGPASPEITRKRRTPFGFTIVELMIVIVVIAILAAISIVAYTNVQNRAHDAAIQNDLRQMGSAIELHRSQYGGYPSPEQDHLANALREQGMAGVSRDSYSAGPGSHVGGHNLAACRLSNSTRMVLVAESQSGRVFAYRDGSVQRIKSLESLPGISITCQQVLGVDSSQSDWGWIFHRGEWRL